MNSAALVDHLLEGSYTVLVKLSDYMKFIDGGYL
jgi:hypothetical protein